MKVRRTLALLGPAAAAGSLALPWYRYAGSTVTGWDTLTGMNWLVSALALIVAGCVVRGSSSLARRVCVAGGGAIGVIGFACIVVRWDHTTPGDGAWLMTRGSGPFVALAAGLATVAFGRALHAREGDVDTARRLLTLIGPGAAVAALSLPWWLQMTDVGYPDGAHDEPWTFTGWESFQHTDVVLVVLASLTAAAALAASRPFARGACVATGVALTLVAAWTLVDSPWEQAFTLTGPVVTLGGGAVTALAGYFLYAPRRSASSVITA